MEFTKDKRPKYTFKWIQFKLKTFLSVGYPFSLAYMNVIREQHSSSNNKQFCLLVSAFIADGWTVLELLQKFSSGIGTFIYKSLCGMIVWNLKICLLVFSFFSQNSFELSYKYDTFCHLSPFYYGTFARKFLLGFAAFMFAAVLVCFCRSSGRTQHNLFQLFSYCRHTFALHTPRKETPRKSHTASIYLLSNPHTHTHTCEPIPHFPGKTQLCKSISRKNERK